MSDFMESLFQSVDILVHKRLEDVSYDSTIVCTITDTSDSKNGKYRVTNGSMTYFAYSDQSDFKNGDQVRVNIPMGDYSQKKFIIGKYVSDEDSTPITYISPADQMLNISGNLANSIQGSILANGSELEKVLWKMDLTDESFSAMQGSNLYNTIIFKADFKTLLNNYGPKEGNYGIKLSILTKPSQESLARFLTTVCLDSSEMFGNPYSFMIYSPQSKVVKIDTMGHIVSLGLTLYQKGNFKNQEGSLITYPSGVTIPDNIIVKNISLGLGCDLKLLEDNKLQIYTTNEPTYLYGMHNEESNLKKMGLLWINKDDNNQYIGFSDGIYDPTYDEIDYLKKSRADSRILAQKGKDGIPEDALSLELSANIGEASEQILKAIKVVNTDILKALNEFKSRVSNVEEFKTNIEKLTLGSGTRSLTKNTQLIEADLIKLQTQYLTILNYGYRVWKGEFVPSADKWNEIVIKSDKIGENDFIGDFNYHNRISETFNTIKSDINYLFSTEDGGGFAALKSEFTGFQSVYDAFNIRIEKLLATMIGHLGQLSDTDQYYQPLNKIFPQSFFKTAANGDRQRLMSYEDRRQSQYTLYQEPDLSSDNNKYCIYWYRYEPDYVAPATEEQIMPNGWKRLTPSDLANNTLGDSDQKNVGLPSLYQFNQDETLSSKYVQFSKYNSNFIYYEEKSKNKYQKIGKVSKEDFELNKTKYYVRAHVNGDGKPIHAPKVSNGNGMIKQYMQHDLEKEKYIAVLFYNHTMYKSNELEFTNSEVIPDKTTLDKGDILIFEHFDNSADSFHCYQITNELLDGSDEHKHRRIRCHYDGLLAKDNAFVGGQIYWYVPANSTMVTVDAEDLTKNRNFVIDEERSSYKYKKYKSSDITADNFSTKKPYIKNSLNGYSLASSFVAETEYYYREWSDYCFYKTIKAEKTNPSAQYEWDKYTYTDNEKNIDNRDFWYKIKPYYEDSAVNNYIKCEFLKYKDADSVWGTQTLSFGTAGTSGTKYTLALTYEKNDVIAASPSTGIPFKVELKDFNNTTLDFNNLKNLNINWDFALGAGTYENMACTTSEKAGYFTTWQNYFGILEISGQVQLTGTTLSSLQSSTPSESNATTNEKTRQINMIARRAIPFTSGEYYIKGPTTIIYNSLGTLDNTSMFNTEYKLFRRAKEDNIKEKDSVVTASWRIKCYLKDGTPLLSLGEDKKKQKEFYLSYMPRIIDNTLVPAPMYLDNLDCYAVVEAYSGSTIYWQQPILIMQNRYSSTLLNDWDGSFQIDEENGTILATMIGAGRKSNNNTFEGVLMGDIGVGTGGQIGFEKQNNIGLGNQTGLGIYGFNDGAQSFGFNIDGTAFLGKAGSGRIIFNGDSGILASANWFTGGQSPGDDEDDPYPKGGRVNKTRGITRSSSAGMCIDLDNGQIDAYNFKLTSANIYLNSTPGDGCLSHINDSSDRYSNYYMRIGDAARTGYIGLTSNGDLEIRVNSLQLTGQLGNKNLFQQTSPRQNQIVNFWITQQYVKKATLTDSTDGSGNSTRTCTVNERRNIDRKSYPYDKNNVYHYTWSVDKWNNSQSTGKPAWNDNNSYSKGQFVTRLGNLWKSGQAINANSDYPPGGDDSIWIPQVTVSSTTSYPYAISIAGNNTQLSQTVKLKNNTKHTISGYVKSNESNKKFKLILVTKNENGIEYSNLDNDITFSQSTEWTLPNTYWHYFRCTFWTPEGSGKEDREIGFSCEGPYNLWHVKLEEGSVATAWSAAPEDVENNAIAVKDQYNYYLNQDRMFNKLFQDKTTGQLADGIQLIPADQTASGKQELYISATYIATGILRSKNWNGAITIERSSLNAEPTWIISKAPTAGTYFDLDNGKMWAATFELDAWNNRTDSGLYLNSNPNNDQDFIRIGNDDGYIRLYKNSSGNQRLILSAWETLGTGSSATKNGFVLRSHPAVGESYFRVGTQDKDEIQFKRISGGTSLYIKAKSFDLHVGTAGSNNSIQISSDSSKNPLKIGSKFSVDWNGNLKASNVDLSGKITATEGTIGGCTISSDGVLQIKNANISGKIDVGKIDADLVTTDELSAVTIDASQITSGTIDANRISASTIAGKLQSHGIGGLTIGSDTNYISVSDTYGGSDIWIRASNYCYLRGYVISIGDPNTLSTIIDLNGTVSTSTSVASVSDRNKKHSICNLTDEYDVLFDKLNPILYKFNSGTSNRFHSGFIAQNIEESLKESNISTQNFAAFIKDIDNNNNINYYLRYEEFVALNTWQIQKLKNRVFELENKIMQLEALKK